MSEFRLLASESAAGRLPAGTVFATWSELSPRDVSAFTKYAEELWPLPPLSEDEANALLDRYHDLMSNIGSEYGQDSLWWYTWSLSKDRFHSRILADMELTSRFEKALAHGLPDRVAMLCRDPYLAHALLNIAKESGVKTRVAAGDRMYWAGRRLKMAVWPLIRSIKACGRMFLIRSRVNQIRASLEHSASWEQSKRAAERTILVTWIKAKNLLDTEPADDTYFGPLPQYLSGPNHSVVVFGDISDRVPARQKASVSHSLSPVIAAASFISNWDLVRSFIRGSISRPPHAQALESEPPYLTPLVRRDLHDNRDAIVHGLLLESGLRRVVKALRPTQIIHMCENNPWERACVRAAAAANDAPQVAGYMHCAAILSHTKFKITETEKRVRPRPSKLICTGPRARDIMVRYGGHSPDEVVEGCALRHGYLASVQPRNRVTQPLRNVLVVLEGLPTMSHFVRFVYDSLDGQSGFDTVIRAHPAYNIERILAEAGLSISDFKTLRISENAQITQDFEDAQVVLYRGSTAAMEAGYLGIPLIHYAHPNLLTDDPLFEINSLKLIVRNPEELIPAIRNFSLMADEEFLRQRDALREYIDEYLSAPRVDRLDDFLPTPLAASSKLSAGKLSAGNVSAGKESAGKVGAGA